MMQNSLQLSFLLVSFHIPWSVVEFEFETIILKRCRHPKLYCPIYTKICSVILPLQDSKDGSGALGRSSFNGANFAAKVKHTIVLSIQSDAGGTLALDGKQIASTNNLKTGEALKVQLNRYVFAEIDDFSIVSL